MYKAKYNSRAPASMCLLYLTEVQFDVNIV